MTLTFWYVIITVKRISVLLVKLCLISSVKSSALCGIHLLTDDNHGQLRSQMSDSLEDFSDNIVSLHLCVCHHSISLSLVLFECCQLQLTLSLET